MASNGNRPGGLGLRTAAAGLVIAAVADPRLYRRPDRAAQPWIAFFAAIKITSLACCGSRPGSNLFPVVFFSLASVAAEFRPCSTI
jgi:hypothetical protein